MPIRRTLALLLLLTTLPACDVFDDEEAGLAVRYEVSGTFDACALSYAGMNGRVNLTTVPLPFEEEIYVMPSGDAPFVAEIAATCTTSGDARTVRTRVLVGGFPANEDAAEGTSVTATAGVAIYADGRIQEL